MTTELTQPIGDGTRFERFAFLASIFCAVECALKPFALLLLPLAGVKLAGGGAIELLLLGSVLLAGGGSIALRWFRGLRSYRPAMLFIAGFAILAGSHFILGDESWMGVGASVAGSLVIAGSLLLRRRVAHECCEYHSTLDRENDQRGA